MIDKVKKAILHYDLLDGVSDITVALSGGADSMSLMYALLELKGEYGYNLYAAHFNHKIRGAEADRDERFVREICKKLGVELFCESADVPKYAAEKHISTELAARECRYDFFERAAVGKVATAHTATDNLETVIFNLARGTALKGLCGIPAKRDIFIRPLIFCARRDIEAYCEEKNIEYVTDSTNLIDDCSRNIIRHNVLPVLREINPNVENAVSRCAGTLKEDADFLSKAAEKEYALRKTEKGLLVKDFEKLDVSIRKRTAAEFCSNATGISPDSFHIEQVLKICAKKGRTQLSGGYFAECSGDYLTVVDGNMPKEKYVYDVSFEKIEENKKINNLLLKNTLDCDKIVGNLTVRTRLSGDKISLVGRNGTKTLKKLFCESHIPNQKRESLPVVCDDLGVVWVCGFGVAKRCAADEKSKNILKINYKVNVVLEDDSYEYGR